MVETSVGVDNGSQIASFQIWFKKWQEEDITMGFNSLNYPNAADDNMFNDNNPTCANTLRTKLKSIIAEVFEDRVLNNYVRAE